MKKFIKKHLLTIWYIFYLVISFIVVLRERLNYNEAPILFYEGHIVLIDILFVSFIVNLKNIVVVTIIYIAIKIATKNFYKSRLTKIDFKKYEGYYRDIIDKYSPAVLSYIDDFKLDCNKVYITTLLDLKRKNKIDILNNEIIKKSEDCDNLDKNESFVLNNLNSKGEIEFKENIIKDALEANLIKEKKNLKDQIKNRLIIYLTVFILFILSILFIKGKVTGLLAVILILMLLYLIFGFIYNVVYILAYYSKEYGDPYERTKKGNEINEKLEGLKNYLQDFSKLSEKDAEAITMWDEYLIYSVMFDQNQKIIEQMSNLKVKEDK